ncbi:MAG TPA: YCF48-related protein [Candidatus Kapabacteria bacterium]|nr:YCF48-related protein [Candidatus Kapabacteria bacterium]
MTITSVAFVSAIVALFAFAPPLTAQQSDQWRRIDPMPGPTYRALTWDDAGMLYLVADGGVIARSADSGRTVTMSIVDAQTAFADIEHDGAGGVWAVGNGGRVYRSVDGANWQSRSVETTTDLSDIAFSTPSIGVVVGRVAVFDTAVMYRTTDAGATWRPMALPISSPLTAVEFHGIVGLAVGTGGTVLRSSDAGATWSVAAETTDGPFLQAVSFASPTVAVAVGSRYYLGQYRAAILRSTDAGVTWSEAVFDVATLELHDVAFASALRGTAIGRFGTVMTTTNGGAVWTAAENLPAGFDNDIEYFDSTYGAAVGRGGAVLITVDGGRTWSPRATTALGGVYSDVALDGSGRIIATGANGHLVISDERQQSLRRIATTVRSALTATVWLPGGDFLAVGDSGVVIRGTPAGDIALATPLGRDVRLNDVTLDVGGTVWMLGRTADSSLVWKSSDTGATWIPVTSPTATELLGISRTRDGDLWVVGIMGEMYRSSDGGATWIDRRYAATFTLRAVHAIDRDTIIAVGDGVLFRTTDAGESWHVTATDLFAYRDIAFADGRNGIVVGNNQKALVTADAGVTWQISTPAIEGGLEGVAVRGGRVVAVSSAGEIVVRDLVGAARIGESAAIVRSAMLTITQSDGALSIRVDPGSTSMRAIGLVDALGHRLARFSPDGAGRSTVRIDPPLGIPHGVYFVVVEMRDGSLSVGRIEL